MPADFVAQLRADRDLYGPASSAQETKRRGKVEGTQAVEEGLAEAGKQIRYLNAIMHNKYTRDAEKLRGWTSATHIERDPKTKKDSGEGTSSSTGATPNA